MNVKKSKTHWVVFAMAKTVTVNAYGHIEEIPLFFAPGMVGAMPVFKNKTSLAVRHWRASKGRRLAEVQAKV